MRDIEAENHWRVVFRSGAIWLILIVAEIIQGIQRTVLLVPVPVPIISFMGKSKQAGTPLDASQTSRYINSHAMGHSLA